MQKFRTLAYKTVMFFLKYGAEIALILFVIWALWLGFTFEPVLPSLDR